MLKVHLKLDVKFSSEILYLYLDFIKFSVEEVISCTQVGPYILKSFTITKLSISFLI